MFTECPTCNTVFRVQPSQLEAAGGLVRCGECLAVFDAREYRRDDLEAPAAEPVPEPAIDENTTADQGTLDLAEPDLFAAELSAAMAAAEESEPAPAPREPEAARPRRTSPPPPPPEPVVPAATAAAPKVAPPKRANPSLDLPFDTLGPAAGSNRSLWTASALLLMVLLAGQYLWFNRQPLSQVPALQPVVEALCRVAPCGLESLPDPSAFELTGRAVQSHPSLQGALLVDVTFVNRTNMARPYPGLELLFTDMEGNTLASRRFTPKEYLGNAPQQPLAPGAEGHAVLELLDPGDLAAGYEFRFF